MAEAIRLSICIATFSRAAFIGETLNSILGQMQPEVEIVVVDGASPDNTPTVMQDYLSRFPDIRYFREQENCGVDRDYDKAVNYARGKFCWLMTDDDLLHPDAIARVLDTISLEVDLVIANAEVKNAELTKLLRPRILNFFDNRAYDKTTGELFFSEVANYLSFIGGVIIKRQRWLERDRLSYFGTLFIHVGVIFQNPPITNVKIIADPLITIRYGNALWSARGFEIWMFKWPSLIWSFCEFSEQSKMAVCSREPWRNISQLFLYRAIGGYGIAEYRHFIANQIKGFRSLIALAIAIFPAAIINSLVGVYCALGRKSARSTLYDVSRSLHATWLSRYLGKRL